MRVVFSPTRDSSQGILDYMADKREQSGIDLEALRHNGEPAIPSIVDTLPLLAIEETIKIEDAIETQYKGTIRAINGIQVPKCTINKGISFLIPLTVYIPLPTPYHASLIAKDEITGEAIGFTCVTIDNYNPRLKLKKQDVLLQLSYAIVTVSNETFNGTRGSLAEFSNLHKVYDQALVAFNSVINAYKATPGRHSHALQAQSALSTPGSVYTLLSEFPSGKVIEKTTVGFHDHSIGDIWHSRMMNEVELDDFRAIHTTDANGNSFPLWLVGKLNEAIDARCNGKGDSAIIFADHYVELSMRFLLYKLLITKGSRHIDARAKARHHNRLDELVKDLAVALGQSPSNFKNSIQYSTWNQSCRKKRNALNHEIERSRITPHESFKAVDSSAIVVKKICEIINAQYPGALADTQWLLSATWMTESMKQAKESRKNND